MIAQATTLKVITGGDTAIDSTHLWAYSSRFGKKACHCKGRCLHCRDYSDPDARWGAKSKDYVFFGYKVHLIELTGIKIDSASMDAIAMKTTPSLLRI
ncbi:hypothetical protein M1O52_05470 [Dehalococcoidia bacterium]|nr:hypothetical protein [Dehalococcoidia bacterium]